MNQLNGSQNYLSYIFMNGTESMGAVLESTTHYLCLIPVL